MKKSIGSLLFFCLASYGVCVAAKGADKVPPFDPQAWERSYTAAYEQRDSSLLGQHISRLYNVAGASREDLIKRVDAEFKKYDKVVCLYRTLEVRPLDRDYHTVVKARTLLKAVPAGQTEPVTLSEGDSYDSLVFENGRWKMYDTVAIKGELAAAAANAFACPAPSAAFNFSAERGDWPAWRAAEQGELIAPQSRVKGAKAFDAKRWEDHVKAAWDSKNIRRVGTLYAPMYNHLGISKSTVLKDAERIFRDYRSIKVSYRVIDFRYLPDSNLVSLKAILEMAGVPAAGGESTTILAVMGYASLQNSGGQWHMYANQPAH
jgi:hypothetical protein